MTGVPVAGTVVGAGGSAEGRTGRFLQLLEGPAGPVGALTARIAADPRHTDLAILLDEPAAARWVDTWRMAPVDRADTGDLPAPLHPFVAATFGPAAGGGA